MLLLSCLVCLQLRATEKDLKQRQGALRGGPPESAAALLTVSDELAITRQRIASYAAEKKRIQAELEAIPFWWDILKVRYSLCSWGWDGLVSAPFNVVCNLAHDKGIAYC